MKLNKNKIIIFSFFLLAFTFFMIFFVRVHPIVIFDTDDWYYTIFNRRAFPVIGEWNPTKVFPETLMPFSLIMGSNILSIFSDDITMNFVIINGFILSGFIVVYVYSFYKIIKTKFELHDGYNILITILFIMLHFLIFRVDSYGNKHMFYSLDACCYYNYLIPALLNISLVMYYINNKTFYFKENKFKSSLLFFAIYLAMFSNLFQSIILASFIGISLLAKICNGKLLSKKNFKKENIKIFIKENAIEILIIVAWIIAQAFEINGGRATSLNSNISFWQNFKETVKNLISIFKNINVTFIWVTSISLIAGITIAIKEKQKNRTIILSFLSSIVLLTYLILLSSKAGAWYISRPDVLIGVVFYIFTLVCYILAYLIKKYELLVFGFPILLLILFFEINTPSITFKDSNLGNISSRESIEINREIINQIKEAAYDNSKIIYIPKFSSSDNWPIAKYGVQRIIDSMYKYGLIKKYFKGNFEISDSYYREKIGYISK